MDKSPIKKRPDLLRMTGHILRLFQEHETIAYGDFVQAETFGEIPETEDHVIPWPIAQERSWEATAWVEQAIAVYLNPVEIGTGMPADFAPMTADVLQSFMTTERDLYRRAGTMTMYNSSYSVAKRVPLNQAQRDRNMKRWMDARDRLRIVVRRYLDVAPV